MPIAEYASGTETVGTTEWSMTTDTSGPDADTTDGVFQAFVDVSALATGDLFEIRVYEKVRSGDSQLLVWSASLIPSSDQVWVSPSLILLHGWDMTLVKISGTDRALKWSIRQVS